MSTLKFEFKKIEAILQTNGEDIKQQLILAAILIMLFEKFKKFMISMLEEFFSNGWTIENDRIIYKRGAEFKELVKSLGKRKSGPHRNDVFRASLYWLHSFDSITINELNEVERIYLIRNDIGHELFNIIVEDRKPIINIQDIIFVTNIYSKVSRWWFKEIEATTNPHIIEHYHSINFESYESLDMTLLKIIMSKAIFGKAE